MIRVRGIRGKRLVENFGVTGVGNGRKKGRRRKGREKGGDNAQVMSASPSLMSSMIW